MRGELTRQINVRLDVSTIEKINDLIRDGEFSNMADFLRYSVNQILKRYEGRSPPLVTEGSPTGLIAAPAGVRLDASRSSIGVKRLNGWLTTARC